MRKIKKIISPFWMLFILGFPGTALAQFDFETFKLEPVGWTEGEADLSDLVGKIVNIVFAILGVLAVAYLIYGGVLYITAGGDAEKAAKGRTAITNAIIGIIIILLAVAIYSFLKNRIG